jgi:hypothetical protein
MSSSRRNTKFPDITLGASQDISTVKSTSLGSDGRLDVQVVIDNGAGVAPTDTPAGAWQLWSSSDPDGVLWSRVTSADTELAKIAPSGNTLVSAYAVLEDVPGTSFKLVYARTSGGATSRARVRVTT